MELCSLFHAREVENWKMQYVPTYLTDVSRGFDGWPQNVSAAEKKWLIEFCRELLLVHGPQDINFVYDQFKYRDDRPKLGAITDYTYACLDRALREVAVQKWVAK
jgi:hypothetical protein